MKQVDSYSKLQTATLVLLRLLIGWHILKAHGFMHPDDVKISLERKTLICQARILTWLTRRVSPV